MSTNNRKILNSYHIIFLAQNVIIGTGILSLPQKLSSMGYSQTFMPLLFGVIASLTLWPMIRINSKYPNENLFRINEILLGKWLGKGINLLITLMFIIFVSGIITNYMRLIQSTALQEQTITVPVLLLLLLIIYIVKGGIKSIARFCIMSFFITIGLIFFTRWAIEKGEFSHFFPLFNFTGKEFYEALKKGYLSILGYELIMFYYPYIVEQKKAYKHTLIGVWISVFICFFTTAVSVMYYSEWQLANIEYSVLNLFKAGDLSFLERIDIMGITLWIFLILTTATAYIWSAKKGIDSLFSKNKDYHIYIITIMIFLIIKIPFPEVIQDRIFTVGNYAIYALIVWPIFLSIIHLFRKKQVQS